MSAAEAPDGGAVDLSAWAVQLNTEGLEPAPDHTLAMEGDGTPLIRLFFAFHPDMPADARAGFAEHLAAVMADAL